MQCDPLLINTLQGFWHPVAYYSFLYQFFNFAKNTKLATDSRTLPEMLIFTYFHQNFKTQKQQKIKLI